ncbi:MAG: hypothetical protein OXC95_02160 [Dehalococcoidia bacterium]|nr:hypothetical protein [Dehalococcoidia bacterium]
MMALKALVVVLAVLAVVVTTTSQETEDKKRYGDCVVWTEVDPMSDEVGVFMTCAGQSDQNPGFGIGREVGSLIMVVAVGSDEIERFVESISFEELEALPQLDIKFRVDRGDIFPSAGWISKDGAIYIESDTLGKWLLDQIARGEKLHFSIENFRTYTVALDNAKEAAADLTERMSPPSGEDAGD